MGKQLTHGRVWLLAAAVALGWLLPGVPSGHAGIWDRLKRHGRSSHFVVRLDLDDRQTDAAEVARLRSRVVEILRARADKLGLGRAAAEPAADGTIHVRVPVLSATERVVFRRALLAPGKLEFYLVDPRNAAKVAEYLGAEATFRPSPGYQARPRVVSSDPRYRNARERVFLKEKPEPIGGQELAQARAEVDQLGNWQIRLSFTKRGAAAFAQLTRANIGRPLAIVIDGTVLSAPVIKAAITDGQAVVTGSFDAAEARRLAAGLSSGSLPVALRIEREFDDE